MPSFAWLRARPRALASVGIVGALAVTIGTLAFVYEGKPTTEVDLHDGGVWVTKQSSMLVGHFNHESRVLDGGLRTSSSEYDLQQNGSRVLVLENDHTSPVLEWMSRAEAQGFTVDTVQQPDDADWTRAVLETIARPGAAPVSLASISSVGVRVIWRARFVATS